ncbi:MAG: UDP-N-acetylglucosamine 1-carboxyvinyltransferase, partial [Patescibacteria group bacterium]
MSKFKINGSIKLNGSVRIGGAKNASYKLMIASLLGDSESRLLNFSRIADVQLVSDIIAYLGAGVKKAGERAIFIDPSSLNSHEIKAEHGQQGRFSTMFIAPLLHKFGQAIVPAPGGDKIGKRPLDRHFDGLKAMGAEIRIEKGMYIAKTEGLKATEYRFAKNTHTGTETLIIAATKAQGRTVLENAAEEPEIDDLIFFLNQMGAKIKRVDNRTIVIDGVKKLSGANHKIISDRNEAVSYACAALATQGD